MDINNLPDRELTPTELRQLIEGNARAIAETRAIADSNARAIEANSESIAQSRRDMEEGFRETRAAVERTSDSIDRLAVAVEADLRHLGQIMEQYFAFQGRTNNSMQDGLESHERRISRLEQPGEG